MIAVPDASAAYEYMARTALGARAAQVLDAADLIAPVLLDVEVLSAVRRATMRGGLSPSRAERLLARLARWDLLRLPVQHLTGLAFQMRHNFSPPDALYVLVARQFDAVLVTSDGRLARAPGLGVAVQYLPAD